MSPTPTAHVENVDFVMLLIVGISVILLLGITATMIYFVFKYNRKKGHQPVDIHGSVLLETIWIVVPTILVLGMFYYGYTGYEEIRNIPKDALEIKVTARMWSWEFEYANGKKFDSLYVPVKKDIKLVMKSQDVNHSFFIPAFRIKEDVIASKENYLGFKAEKLGEYDIACAEYCGLNHSMMYSKVKVVSEKDFDSWLNSKSEILSKQDSTLSK
ncbi:MAG: cytochrome c oxidase subunit II [Ignavibacteriales bacterium CG_4_9_14_3_um_filter_34_10]|nr:MAG: cytochrome c oxidase subunit II [Ignavibacteriales bacterium CG_4_9_14_3_um_filter_34_10]